jgi:hypothetical protein
VDKNKSIKENVGTGDGSTTVFTLKNSKIVSKDYTGSPAASDIYIYLNNSDTPETSTNYSIDAESGEVTFNSAPSAGYKIEATYWHSTISDDDIENLITFADSYINDESGRSFPTSGDVYLQHTQYWDGDGKTKTFFFERMPLYSVQSITVDGNSSLTVDTDYYLYPTNTEAYWIEFETTPSNDNKNVYITYEYGQQLTDIVTRLSTNLAAQEAVEQELARRGTSGAAINVKSTGKIVGSTNRYINTLRVLRIKEDKLWELVGRKRKARSIK